jgi:MFS family permease
MAGDTTASIKGLERHILINTCYGHFISHFNMLVFPALVLPLTLRFNLEMADILGLSFWMYLLFGLTALPWGILADRLGAKPLFRLFYMGAGSGGLAAALWMDTTEIFPVCLAAIGFFSGIYHPAGLGMISKEIKKVSVAMGFNGMFGNLGLALAPLITGLVNWQWGPRAAYAVVGMLNLFGLVLMGLFPIRESAAQQAETTTQENGALKIFAIFLITMMLGGIVYRGATVVVPAYFEIKTEMIFTWAGSWLGEGLSRNLLATTLTSILFFIGMLGQYTGGRVAQRFDLRFCYLIFHLITIPMVVIMGVSENWTLTFFAVIYFFFLLGMQPIENTLVAKITPKKFHHSAYGTKFILTFGVGALSVKMVETIASIYRLESVFWVLGMISCLLVGAIGLLIYVSRKSSVHGKMNFEGDAIS